MIKTTIATTVASLLFGCTTIDENCWEVTETKGETSLSVVWTTDYLYDKRAPKNQAIDAASNYCKQQGYANATSNDFVIVECVQRNEHGCTRMHHSQTFLCAH